MLPSILQMVVPVHPPPQTGPISFPPNLKSPILHLNAGYLMLYLNHGHLLEFRHFGGLCGARCVFCTHFGREKVHFWSCPDRPLLQDISIINVKCYICCKSNLEQGYWKSRRVGGTHTRDTGEKDRLICRSIPAASFSPFLLWVTVKHINYIKI